MYATVNRRLGVVGGFSDVVERLSERSLRVGWRGSFLVGLGAGALLFALVAAPERRATGGDRGPAARAGALERRPRVGRPRDGATGGDVRRR
jgi:hypothetical protein